MSSPIELLRMTDGLVVHQALCAAAKLGIADLLANGARDVAGLARELCVDEGVLYRILRFLAGQGVFRELGARTFANSALSEFLRSDVAGSVRAILIFRGSSHHFAPLGELLYSIETGIPAFRRVFGAGVFDYLRAHREEARVFDDAMTALSALWAPAVAAAYDFGQWESIMDVGGGNGLLLAEVLRAHPRLIGVLADHESVLQRARQRGFLSGDLEGRVRFEPADFFEGVPAGCRAVLMKNVIHDWQDDDARRILRNVRDAVPDDGALLLVEYAVGEANAATMGKMVDIVMLTATGGKERTAGEHRELLASAGFRLSRAIAVAEDLTLVEALP